VTGLTLDTGALIALERRSARIAQALRHAADLGLAITVPAVIVAEWWRGRTDWRETILLSVDVEPMTEKLARAAGDALAAVTGSSLADAIVMASAARRGDIVYTSDVADLERLRQHFRSVPCILRV
jgi:predicted nucleic acid-binding protein